MNRIAAQRLSSTRRFSELGGGVLVAVQAFGAPVR